jgi:hypothetical protein
VWRYLDIVKLLDMLDRRALYLARADTMTDPWEAVMPPLSVDAHIDQIREQVGSRLESPETLKDEYVAFQRQTRSRTFLSCWYVSQHESAAMWDLYGGREGHGVAIQSTFHRLEQALRQHRQALNLNSPSRHPGHPRRDLAHDRRSLDVPVSELVRERRPQRRAVVHGTRGAKRHRDQSET